MDISEMLQTLIRLGHISPRQDSINSSLGTYENVPSITVYGNPLGSSMMTQFNDAKLEQYSPRNLPGAGS